MRGGKLVHVMGRLLPFTRPLRFLLVSMLVVWPVSAASVDCPVAPPKTIADYYPPRDPGRSYTVAMLELGKRLGILAIPSGEEATSSPNEALSRFEEAYRKAASMVPEWQRYYPEAPIKTLETAIASGDGKRVEQAVAGVQAVCTRCHMNELAAVQAIYGWTRFREVTARDTSGRQVPFHETMVKLSSRLAAMPEAVAHKRWEEGAAAAKKAIEQFLLLEDSCYNCHEEARRYFVTEEIRHNLVLADRLLRSRKGKAADFEATRDTIYRESCIPCHQIHMPAAYLQERIRKETEGK